MKRPFLLAYGLVAYLLFNAAFLYMIGFLLDFPGVRSINEGPVPSLGTALAANAFLVFLFGFFHSLMARKWFKDWWTKFCPEVAERSTYVIQSAMFLSLATVFWQPIPAVIWHVEGALAVMLYASFAVGVGLLLWATFAIDHFELFGLRQVWSASRGSEMPKPMFKTPYLYRFVRHPMQLGIIILLFSTPLMTVGHAVFASLMTVYVMVGLYFEEHSLMREFGDAYSDYKATVPMLIPFTKRASHKRVAV